MDQQAHLNRNLRFVGFVGPTRPASATAPQFDSTVSFSMALLPLGGDRIDHLSDLGACVAGNPLLYACSWINASLYSGVALVAHVIRAEST